MLVSVSAGSSNAGPTLGSDKQKLRSHPEDPQLGLAPTTGIASGSANSEKNKAAVPHYTLFCCCKVLASKAAHRINNELTRNRTYIEVKVQSI